jgi:hypothetical protein
VNLTLTVNPNKTTDISASICDGQSATAGGQFFTTPGLHTVILQTSLGCDSIINLTLTVYPLPATPVLQLRNDSLIATGSTGVQYNWYLDNVYVTSTIDPAYKPTQQGNWKVTVVSSDGCLSAASTPLIVTGTRNNKAEVLFDIIPNPSNGQFELRITSIRNEQYQLAVYDLAGQVILREIVNIQAGANIRRYSLDNAAKGMYFITLTGEEGIATKNLAVQ